jgi:UDP-N-acetylmuramyl pentapeptide phosphotransferase/UDP-N-acetylglucosamine-1-phosphate transferase
MMGDAGSNALGAAWGVAAVSQMSRSSLLGTLGVIAGLTLLSERVSFSDLIARNPVTSWLDDLGRATPPTA